MTASTTDAAQRRRHRGALGAALAACAVAVAAVAALVAGHDQRAADVAQNPGSSASEAPFGQHYDTLVQRRTAAQLPTMMDTMSSPTHYHPLLRVLVDGKRIPVPANLGIDPTQPPMQMAGLHTHDTSGTIHVEGVDHARLGQFFAVWGVALNPDRLGPYRSSGAKRVRMWVDGKPSTAFGSLPLAEGQHIVISYGTNPKAPTG